MPCFLPTRSASGNKAFRCSIKTVNPGTVLHFAESVHSSSKPSYIKFISTSPPSSGASLDRILKNDLENSVNGLANSMNILKKVILSHENFQAQFD